MSLNREEMLALLSDNTEGDISAEDLRNIITGVMTLTDDNVGTFDFEIINDVQISSTTFENIAELDKPQRNAGVYQITVLLVYSYSSTQRKASFRWKLNDLSWVDFQLETKDAGNTETFFYSTPFTFSGGEIDLKIEGKCGRSSDSLEILNGNITIERKK